MRRRTEGAGGARWRRDITLFLAGQTASLFGSVVVQYAVMWWVTLETRSGLAVALYAVAAFLPQGIVLLAVAARSVGAGFQTPAVQAMIPQIVPPEQLMRVNGTFQTVQSAMALIAPAAAGAIYAAVGLAPVFFLDAITAVAGILLLALVAVPTLERAAGASTTYRQDLVEGMRYIRKHPVVHWLLAVYAIIFLLTVAPAYVPLFSAIAATQAPAPQNVPASNDAGSMQGSTK